MNENKVTITKGTFQMLKIFKAYIYVYIRKYEYDMLDE